MTAEADDKTLPRKALDGLMSAPSLEPVIKPGERLAPDSGYPKKFIEDYNKFQEAYKAQHDTNPGYWDYGQKWWAQVRQLIDQYRDAHQDRQRGQAIDRMLLGPPPIFQREAPGQ